MKPVILLVTLPAAIVENWTSVMKNTTVYSVHTEYIDQPDHFVRLLPVIPQRTEVAVLSVPNYRPVLWSRTRTGHAWSAEMFQTPESSSITLLKETAQFDHLIDPT
jgi:hypothetical protein